MRTRRIAVVGIDGTGKSTLVDALSARLQSSGQRVRTCRALQLSGDADWPLGHLSRSLDLLSSLGDELGLPALKGVALFLGMSLYGPAETFITTVLAPEWLVTERHPLIDAVTYAKFYAPLMRQPIERANEGQILTRLAQIGVEPGLTMAAIEDWIRQLPVSVDGAPGFFEFPVVLHALFQLPPAELFDRLREIFRVDLPEHVAWLKAGIETANARISAPGEHRRPTRELHETQDILTLLQAAYGQTCASVAQIAPQTQVLTLETDAHHLESVVDSLLSHARMGVR